MDKNQIGKSIIIGIKFFNEKEKLLEQYQTHGIIDSITKFSIEIKRDDGSIYTIPNDNSAIKKAEPGIYSEKTTGKIIENPDLISQWTVKGKNTLQNIENHKKFGFIVKES